MQLKKLELYGFKSFSDKTVIELDKGITGIVGPNGCGKSNIVDSVMWVLGEQSVKQLRGSKMDDVVFKGSDKRKPNGFAEVSITLDNSDGVLPINFNEVLISRRLYRSGESSYKINGAECRLKDITALFMDSGVGKYGYSIIGQGRVSEILNATPEGRRYIFDEAAGIMKYKTRKEESEKHLFMTRENLARANDLIYEIESRLPQLKTAAERAEKYLGVAALLKRAESTRFVLLNERYKAQEERLAEQIALLTNDIEQNEAAKATATEGLAQIDARHGEVSAQCEKLRTNRMENIRMAERLKGEYKYLCERIEQLKREKIQNGEAVERYRAEAELLADQLESELKRRNEALAALDVAKENTAKQEERVEELRQAHEALAARLRDARQLQASYASDGNAKALKLAQLTTRLEMLESGKDDGGDADDNRLIEAELLCNDAKAELDRCRTQLAQAKEQTAAATQTYSSVRAEYTETATKAENIAKTAESQKARLLALNEMKESMESFNNSTKAVLKLKNAGKTFSDDIIGAVSEIIRVEKRFETAIEVALGGAVQNIVTKTDTGAKQIIEYLRNNRLGYATFLPLNSVQGRRISENDMRTLRQKGFLGAAVDLVKFDREYTAVAENLLGRVVIAEDMDSAIAIARASRYMFRIVTLEGDVINPYGSISGGSRGKSNVSNVFSRSREIDELETALKTNIEELKGYNAAMVALRQKRDSAREALEKAQRDEHDYELALNSTQKSYEFVVSEYENAKKAKALSDEKRLNVNDEIKRVSDEISALQMSAEEVAKAMAQINNEVDELAAREEMERKTLTAQELKLTDARLKQMECESRLQVSQSSVDDLDGRKTEREQETQRLTALIAQQDEELLSCVDSAEDHKQRIEQSEAAEAEEIRVLKECEDDLKSLDKLKRAREDEIRSLEAMLSDIKSKQYTFEMEKTKVIMESDSLQSRMWEVYQVSLGDALASEREEGDIEALNKKIRDHKSEITRMGAINPEAPQQYEEQSAKWKTLCDEREDMNAAIRDIEKLIADITGQMRERFDEEFKIINEYFTEMFKKLFGGGSARLELCNSEDILEAGIDIIAQPPGKKLQNISLMSGGEKALIATALLFALLKRRPAPFCILDEIDTALDEKNVYSLANLIKTFDDKMQFIIISHRKGTMEASNAMYGVSMAEKGVSSLVSVRLEDY